LAIILVPVLFGLMGFALDLGRLYLIRGELNQAANAMAIAAASQLIGTSTSTDNAAAAATQSLDDTNHQANKYYFGSLLIGQSGTFNSRATPSFFATIADATAGNPADGTTAQHVQIDITAEAPLLFWSVLPGAESRRATVAARAVAGVSAPVCTACGIEPIAVAAIDPADTVNFGLGDPAAGQLYTLAYQCAGTPGPAALTGTLLRYTIVNRFDTAGTLDETQQLYRDAAGGLIASTAGNRTGSTVPMACMAINDPAETMWASLSPNLCSTGVPSGVANFLCGLYSRFDNLDPPGVCSANVADFSSLSTAYLPDTDVSTGTTDPYSAYTGNGRRVITVAVVDTLATSVLETMTVLGFRQFLLELNTDGTFLNPAETSGRFVAQYIGSPKPVRQGYFDDRFQLSCPIGGFSGPGKVVLHQ
jgi:Flp pilus assembly protein TadG